MEDISASGIGFLLVYAGMANQKSKVVALVCADKLVRKNISKLGIDKIIGAYDNLGDFLSSLPSVMKVASETEPGLAEGMILAAWEIQLAATGDMSLARHAGLKLCRSLKPALSLKDCMKLVDYLIQSGCGAG